MTEAKHYLEFYVGDYLRDTAHLSPAQHGVYLLLLFHYWQKGMLQASFEQAARIARASTPAELEALQAVLVEYFPERDGRYINNRMDAELAKFAAKKAKAHARAVAGAGARWGKPTEPADASSNASSNAPSTGEAMLAPCPPTPTPAVVQLPSLPEPPSSGDGAVAGGMLEGHTPEQSAAAAAPAIAMVKLATRLRALGCPVAGGSDAYLVQARAEGFTEQELVDMASLHKGKPVNYLLKALRTARTEAGQGATTKPMGVPARTEGPSPKKPDGPAERIAAAVDFAAQQVALKRMTTTEADAYVAGVKTKYQGGANA